MFERVSGMPLEVRAARRLMWSQAAAAAVNTGLAAGLLGDAEARRVAATVQDILTAWAMSGGAAVLFVALAVSYTSRRKLVRWGTLAIEGYLLAVFGHGLMWVDFGVRNLLVVTVSGVVMIYLSRPAASRWFNR